MSFTFLPLFGLVLAVVGVFLAFKILQGVFWALGRIFRGGGTVLAHVGRFVRNMLVDSVHFAGATLTGMALLPLAIFNAVFGRFAAAKHYGRAIEDELGSALLGLYRLALGHPLRLLCLGGLLDGVERRVPDVVDRAPQPVPRTKGGPDFPGYHIFGTLQAGGSGAKLYLARPTAEKRSQLREAGHGAADEVVIKYFALEAGSTLPQIVRENQALKAANRLGLVLEHELSKDRFYYVMRYVSGEELDTVIHRLHASCGPEGLGDEELGLVGAYGCEVLHTLDRFHGEGLWHKDVKPSNLIVADRHVHLVDLGLVTPLQADITLTTHGTEYYRDPEMVRLALQGVRVHEVDGAKFDIYSAGAVLYSMIENSFPAHGSLSKISKRCPEALRWIIRRAMTDMHARYGSAREMLRDLRFLANAKNAFEVMPADLPSFQNQDIEEPKESEYTFPGPGLAMHEAPRPVRQADYAAYSASVDKGGRAQGYDGTRRGRRAQRILAMAIGAFIACTLALALIQRARHVDSLRARDHMRALQSRLMATHDPVTSLNEEDQAVLDHAHGILGSPESQHRIDHWADRLSPEIKDWWFGTEHEDDTGHYAPGPDSLTGAQAHSSIAPIGRILLLEDLVTPDETEILASVREALADMDLTVLGTPESVNDPLDIELMSGARHAVGLASIDDPEAQQRLQDFLDGRDDLDAILWIGPAPTGSDPIYELFVRSILAARSTEPVPSAIVSR